MDREFFHRRGVTGSAWMPIYEVGFRIKQQSGSRGHSGAAVSGCWWRTSRCPNRSSVKVKTCRSPKRPRSSTQLGKPGSQPSSTAWLFDCRISDVTSCGKTPLMLLNSVLLAKGYSIKCSRRPARGHPAVRPNFSVELAGKMLLRPARNDLTCRAITFSTPRAVWFR